jgi:serine/threonine-protein kinase
MSAPQKTPDSMREGTPFGKYVLLDCIAESVMSKVYRARLTLGRANRIVVVKTLHPRFLTDQKSWDLFHREIQTSMTLAHGNIVQIHDFGEESGTPFIVMEWVHGRNFRQVVRAEIERTRRGLVPLVACHFIEQVAQGLEYAHTLKDKLTGQPLKVIHRDLSPHNLIAGFDGTIKLIDFGIAKMVAADSDTMSDQVWGKVGYLSPEQASGQKVDHRSDLFSLGVVFFELLSGTKLFDAENNLSALALITNTDAHVPHVLARLKGLPEPLARIITKCTRFKREERYGSANEISRELRSFMRVQKEQVDAAVVTKYMELLFPGGVEMDQFQLREVNASARPSVARATLLDEEATVSAPVPALEQVENTPYPAPEVQQVMTSIHTVDQKVDLETGALQPPRQPAPEEAEKIIALAKDPVVQKAKPKPASLQQNKDAPARVSFKSLGIFLSLMAGVVALALVNFSGVFTDSVVVKLNIQPEPTSETLVLFDGQPVTLENGGLPSIAWDQPHELEIHRPGFRDLKREVRIPKTWWSGGRTSLNLDLLPLRGGGVTIKTDREGMARISDGKNLWVRRTPVDHLELPPGHYQLALSAQGRPERILILNVELDTVVLVDEKF